MKTKLFFNVIIILCLITQISCATNKIMADKSKNKNNSYKLDFKYKPSKWQTAICLPDDWQKSIVGKNGEMLYDHYARSPEFATKMKLSLSQGKEKWISQKLESSKVPVVSTVTKYDGLELTEQTFAVTDDSDGKTKPRSDKAGEIAPQLEVHDARRFVKDFAKPTKKCDPNFINSEFGDGAPLVYKFVGAGSGDYYFAFCFCESGVNKPGERVQKIKIENELRKTVDAIADAGKNVPFVKIIKAKDKNGDGIIDIEIVDDDSARYKCTSISSLWVFDEKPDADDILLGKNTINPIDFEIAAASRPAKYSGPPRTDLIIATVKNTESSIREFAPQFNVESEIALKYNLKNQSLFVRNRHIVNLPFPVENITKDKNNLTLHFEKISLKPNETFKFVIAIQSGAAQESWSVAEAEAAHNHAEKYWENFDLPYDVIQVPDPNVQNMLNSCIRNIYQAREIKDGLPAFQVGPTIYRGLWIVDGAFLLESVAALGQGKEARAGIEYMLSKQNNDGSFEVIGAFWKETGIVLWTIDRHEELTGDRKWLEDNWTKVKRAADFIKVLRERSREDTNALHYGLIPAGYSDGGLHIDSEYTNPYWLLVGLKSAVSMAKRTGRIEQAKEWQEDYDDLWKSFKKLAKRDIVTDEFGNKVLPVHMTRPLKEKPQKGQWAFLHAVYPGGVFSNDDPILIGNLANLEANEKEGLVLGTGWDNEGLWGYFGSFYAHAFLQMGRGEKAAQIAYDFANHASPLLVWREEQRPVDHPDHHFVGDMPHNWASAEFIRLILHLLVFERGDELHLFEGLPKSWLNPGAKLSINNAATRFGLFSMKLEVSKDGKTAKLQIICPKRNPPKQIIVNTENWEKLEKGNAEPCNKGFVFVPKAGKEYNYVLKLK